MGRRPKRVNVLSELKFKRAAATLTTTCLIYLGKSFPSRLYRCYHSTIIIIGIMITIIISYDGTSNINGHIRRTLSPIGHLVEFFIQVDFAKAITFTIHTC